MKNTINPDRIKNEIEHGKHLKKLKWLEDSPDETAFFGWGIKRKFEKYGFKNVKAIPYDFMHSFIRTFLIKLLKPFIDLLDKIPTIKEKAGSLIISAEK